MERREMIGVKAKFWLKQAFKDVMEGFGIGFTLVGLVFLILWLIRKP